MSGTISKILIAVTLFMAATLGGMALFDMGTDMGTGMPCADQSCDASLGSDAAMTGAECVDHCLRVASPDGSVPAATSLSIALLVLILVRSFERPAIAVRAFASHRWRDGIGKFLLQQQLSTVVLRD